MSNRLVTRIFARALQARGYSGYFAERIYGKLRNDLRHGTTLGMRRRLWAYRHGFLGDTLVNYGLTPENCGDYVGDLPYLKLHPLNAPWSKWIDDKLTVRYVLAPFSRYLPKYYFHLTGQTVLQLMDCPESLSSDGAGVIQLLQQEKQLAVKIISGSGGEGFFKVAAAEGGVMLNDRTVAAEEFRKFLDQCRDHLVTEYLSGHAFLKRIYPKTANTIRVCTLHEPNHSPVILGAFIRFGTSQTGSVDNVTAGGIVSGVRTEDGALFRAGTYRNAQFVELTAHPETGVPISGTVPHWELVTSVLLQICKYLPQLPYLGFDVVVTEDGFKIIEINSHPSSHVFQQYYPLLKSSQSRQFFMGIMQARGIKPHRL